MIWGFMMLLACGFGCAGVGWFACACWQELGRPYQGAQTAAGVAAAAIGGPWYPPTLPELPTAAELAAEVAYANRLVRHRPRPIPLLAAAQARITAVMAVLGPVAVAAGIVAQCACDRPGLLSWPDLAPAWDDPATGELRALAMVPA